ncbi:Pycsar system effector family protein [Streptomyces sp. NPDC001027]|uniref:Pycsar system effector family protein n=1 Tax=Streptomyces sp. NPDC001027 TaxID=3154771 RepID=UPI00332E749B
MSQQPPDLTEQNLSMADSMLGKELVRHDTKASLLIAVDGGIMALVAAIARNSDLSWHVRLLGTLGLSALAASVLVLLLSIRPALGGRSGEGWEIWSALGRGDLLIHMKAERRPDRVLFLSRVVHRKFRRLRLAVDLLITGFLFFVVATLVTATGH